ncbi:hypothetical protein, partial [Klebsiella pneumoniae]|uniref:hypothetical protein n=3 Tax=Klebsiella pneumoniae TaxID=573 RepID=UPI001C6FA2CB
RIWCKRRRTCARHRLIKTPAVSLAFIRLFHRVRHVAGSEDMMARLGVSGAQCRNFSENYKILFTLFLIGASSFNYLTKLHK